MGDQATSMDQDPRRCAKRANSVDNEDRISQLPSSILGSILGSVSLKEAAQTSILSKAWRRVWLFTDALDFDAYEVLKEKDQVLKMLERGFLSKPFVEWVDWVLHSKSEATDEMPKKLRIRAPLEDTALQQHMDGWLSYAVANRIQSMEFDFSRNSDKDFLRYYPNALTFPPVKTALDCQLRSISLSGVRVSQQAMDFFLHKLPLLERLRLRASPESVHLRVCSPSPSLKHLEIEGIWFNNPWGVVVRDSSLVSLTLFARKGSCFLDLVLENNPDLVAFHVSELTDKVVGQISHCLPKLQSLTLYAAYDAPRHAKLLVPGQLNELKQLTLTIDPAYCQSLGRVTAMLSSSPMLEKFALEFIFDRAYYKKARVASENRKYKKGPSLPLQHLQVFEVRGYYGDVAEDNILRYILEHAVAPLKTITFDPYIPPRGDSYREKKINAENRAQLFRRVIPDSFVIQFLPHFAGL